MRILPIVLISIGLIFLSIILFVIYEDRRSQKIYKNPIFKALKTMHELMSEQESKDGKVPGGFGEFGFSSTNPIPVSGIMGEINYLARLMTKEGLKVEYERLGQAAARNINNPIDIFEIRVKGEYLCKLFLCPYYKEMSDIAPVGFELTMRK